jgi:hypothetical protein
MKAIKLIFLCLLIIPAMVNCHKETEPGPFIISIDQIPTNTRHVNYPIQNTTWKLLGFANLTDSTFKYAEPKNDFAYKLCFTTDSTFNGTSSVNQVLGRYAIDMCLGTMEVIAIGGTKVNEILDGDLFRKNLRQIESYSITEYGLSLYFLNGNQYLLYIPLSR